MWYAERNTDFGVRVTYESGGFEFYAFDSKYNRDAWLNDHRWEDAQGNQSVNLMASETPYYRVRRELGRDFFYGAPDKDDHNARKCIHQKWCALGYDPYES